MGNEEMVKYFVCSVKGGRHCDKDKESGSGNQRLEVRVSNDCSTDGKSFISLTPFSFITNNIKARDLANKPKLSDK